MKIALLGNLANTAYNLAKMLRRGGVDAEVFISNREGTSFAGAPAWEDLELLTSPVDWIHCYRDRNPLSLLQLLSHLRKYDVVHACASSVMLCQFAGVPVVSHALGADLKEVAHEKSLRGRLMRRGFRRSRQVLFSDLDHIPHLSTLSIEGGTYLSAAVDTDKYCPGETSVEGDIPSRNIVLFHSSIISWKGKGVTEKNNDLFLRAFARCAQSRDDLRLLIIDAGPEASAAKALVTELGVAAIVKFLPPMNKATLLQYYRRCDVIVDQFGMPKLGVNALEGMACGKAVMVSLDTATVSECYQHPPPALACSTEAEILEQLNMLSKREARRVGEESRDWILQNHRWDLITTQLTEIYSEAAGPQFTSPLTSRP